MFCIDELTELIEYLDDNTCKALLSLIYGRERFYLPLFCDNYKAFMFNILLEEHFPIEYDKLSYEEVKESMDEFLDLTEEDYEDEIYTLNTYRRYKAALEAKGYDLCGNESDIKLILDFDNELHLPVQNTAKLLLEYLKRIIESIKSFSVKIALENNKLEYKRFLNEAILQVCNNKCCFTIYDKSLSQVYLKPICRGKADIRVISYNLIKKNNMLYLSDGTNPVEIKLTHYTQIKPDKSNKLVRSLTGARSVNRYLSTINNIKTTLEKFNKVQIKKRNCHICCPILANDKQHKQHKCSTCEDIYEIIKKISQYSYTTKYINERIKGNPKVKKKLSINLVRKTHYERLMSLLRDIKDNYESYTKYENDLKILIDTAFGDIKEK